MDRQAELQAERDALEAELLALEQTIQHQWPQGTVVPAELVLRPTVIANGSKVSANAAEISIEADELSTKRWRISRLPTA
jgi:hypothetical protein